MKVIDNRTIGIIPAFEVTPGTCVWYSHDPWLASAEKLLGSRLYINLYSGATCYIKGETHLQILPDAVTTLDRKT